MHAQSMVRTAPASANLYEILDLILDKGLVVDVFVRASLVGIEILTVEARIVIASVDTFLRYAEAMAELNRRHPRPALALDKALGGLHGVEQAAGIAVPAV